MNMRDNNPEGGDDFISHYLRYIGHTEAPTLYHRWCAMAALGTFLGRNYSYQFGHSRLHTNLYVMLIGVPATRKSTAIKIAKKVLISAGYNHISADRTSKEKFLLDLAGDKDAVTGVPDDLLEQNLWGGMGDNKEPHEMWIACDEFNDFIGTGNVEFISMLGNLWDFEGTYENRIKSGKSVSISEPTISILGGNTPVNFAHAFPPEILGQGFFSRLLLIHADPTGKRIAFPVSPSSESTVELIEHLTRIREYCIGEAVLTQNARALLDRIYRTYGGIDDSRFEHYIGRRFTHLLKLCLVISASRCSRTINSRDVIVANTILTHTESLMPKALGEFGKSKNSDINHKVIQILSTTDKPLSMKELWAQVSTDMESIGDLGKVLMSLIAAEKIMSINGSFLNKRKALVQEDNEMLDFSILTEEEREAAR